MPLFRRRHPEPPPVPSTTPEELVKLFLRAQNLEQVGDLDGAAALYEQGVEAGFDAAGPYDRLIYIYGDRGAHADVARVAEAALGAVKTFDAKREWYQKTAYEATVAAASTKGDERGSEFR